MIRNRFLSVLVCITTFALCGHAHAKFAFASMTVSKEHVQGIIQAHPVDVLSDGRKELVLVQRDAFSVLTFDENGFQVRAKIPFPAADAAGGKTYYSFARCWPNGKVQVVLMTRDGLMVYPIENDQISPTPILLLKKPLIQGQSGSANPQYLEFALDMDKDGLDDFLIPEANGFSLYRQSGPMKLTQVALPRNPYTRKNTFYFNQENPDDSSRIPAINAAVNYRKGVDNLLLFDADSDGRQDLIYSSTRHGKSRELERFEIFLQGRGMEFRSSPSQTIEIPYESNSDVTFRDLNRDRRLDAIISRSNFDLVNPRTLVKFYIAGSQASQVFEKETDRFVTKDPFGLVSVQDFNGDSITDFAMTFFNYQFGSAEDIVDLALAGKVKFKLQFFLGNGGRGFNRTPDTEQELVLNVKESAARGAPLMIVDDINGDKFMDIAVRREDDKLDLYASEGTLKYGKDATVVIDLPADSGVVYEDMNSDGMTDVIVYSASKQHIAIHFALNK
jgi:hypothetical protein